MSTELHERMLSIETQPLDGDRLAVHAELRDVRHVDMPSVWSGRRFSRASNAQVGSCHMWRADGPLASVEGSPNPRESV